MAVPNFGKYVSNEIGNRSGMSEKPIMVRFELASCIASEYTQIYVCKREQPKRNEYTGITFQSSMWSKMWRHSCNPFREHVNFDAHEIWICISFDYYYLKAAHFSARIHPMNGARKLLPFKWIFNCAIYAYRVRALTTVWWKVNAFSVYRSHSNKTTFKSHNVQLQISDFISIHVTVPGTKSKIDAIKIETMLLAVGCAASLMAESKEKRNNHCQELKRCCTKVYNVVLIIV